MLEDDSDAVARSGTGSERCWKLKRIWLEVEENSDTVAGSARRSGCSCWKWKKIQMQLLEVDAVVTSLLLDDLEEVDVDRFGRRCC